MKAQRLQLDFRFSHMKEGEILNKSILFVDDEKSILNSIKREFFDSDYDIYFASGGEEALCILDKFNNIDMIVTDMKMPNIDGYELLKRVKSKYPSMIRIILSGYTDESIVFKCICNNLAKIYITKPWDEDQLQNAINDVFKNEEVLNNINLFNSLKNLDSLPTLPRAISKINMLLEDENVNINSIIDLIEEDPPMASKILRVINSAFYGLKTASVKKAVLNLGLSNLKNLIVATEVFDFDISSFNKELIWKHSSMVNKIVVEFLKKYSYKNAPDYYSTAALLHDIGKIALIKLFPNKYDNINKMLEVDENIPFDVCERNIFNITHEELGAYLLRWWDIPNPIVEVALYHHKPMLSSESNREIVSIVHIVDYYAWRILYPKLTPQLDRNSFNHLRISKDEFDIFIENIDIGVI